MKYKVLTAVDGAFTCGSLELSDQVNAAIYEGWKSLGGVAMAQEGRRKKYAQAMILED